MYISDFVKSSNLLSHIVFQDCLCSVGIIFSWKPEKYFLPISPPCRGTPIYSVLNSDIDTKIRVWAPFPCIGLFTVVTVSGKLSLSRPKWSRSARES